MRLSCRIFRSCVALVAGAGLLAANVARAQTAQEETPEQKVERLSTTMTQVQSQIQAYEKQLQEMREQLTALQQQMAARNAVQSAAPAAAAPTLQERIETVESQISTHDTLKVESASKYPVTVSGLVLLNAYVNTNRVDVPATPTYAQSGAGSTGLSLRQTLLGLDARGPHVFGASSHADLRVDFFGSTKTWGYSGGGLLRLRTAHASLNWENTEAFAEYDRSILVPDMPTSLASVAVPPLSWSGNLWTWNPQVGVSHSLKVSDSTRMTMQAALIDVGDPMLPSAAGGAATSLGELSRWPGIQARLAAGSNNREQGARLGVGGYFAPHRASDGTRFDAWAGTLDLRLPVTRFLQLTSSVYRGQALGGLGGGGYADYVYGYDKGMAKLRALHDVGGWAQLKLLTGRFDTNLAYGLDNPFANQLRYIASGPNIPSYPGLARNSTFLVNSIYSPSAYIQFSLEYKRLFSTYPHGDRYDSHAIGIAAAYKF